jgi:hypothetical protein
MKYEAVEKPGNSEGFPVVVSGKEVCCVNFNSRSPKFLRSVVDLIECIKRWDGVDLGALPDTGGELDENGEAAGGILVDFAANYDALESCVDKVIGAGNFDKIMDEDNETLAVLMACLEPVFEKFMELNSELGTQLDSEPVSSKAKAYRSTRKAKNE